MATVDAAGCPHIVPICYAYDSSRLYSAVDEKPKRVEANMLRRLVNIRGNPRVCVIIDDYDEDWSRLAYLLVRGRAEVVANRNEYTHALEVLRERYPQYRQMPLAFDTHPLVRLTPERWHFWRADASGGSAGR